MLFALDIAELGSTGDDRVAVRKATRVITSKFWPEVGDLLGGGEQ